MFLPWRSPGEGDLGDVLYSISSCKSFGWYAKSEGGHGNSTALGGSVGASLAAASKLSPPAPPNARGAVAVPCMHNKPSVPQAQKEILSKKVKGLGIHLTQGQEEMQAPAWQGHKLPLSSSQSMTPFRS